VPGRAGGYPTGPPTVPDERNSRIRFLSIRAAVTVRITSRLTKPPGAELGCPSLVAGNPLRRLVGSKSFPSVLPVTRSPRPRLPSRGSLGPHFPTFVGTMLSYDCPVPVSGRFACRSRPNTLAASSLCVPLWARWQLEALCHRQGSWSAGTPALPAFWTKETRGSPKFPSFPCDSLPCSQTPVESVALALTRLGLLPSAPCTASAFPRSGPARLSLRSTTILISGLHHTAWGLAPSGSVLPSRGLHAEFATELLARLYSGGT
jgi:hypothetical protein